MSGPKHLWSGDWRNESRQPAAEPPPTRTPEPEAQPPEVGRGPRFSRRQLALALTAGVATAAVAVALVTSLSGSSPKKHTGHRAASTAPAPAPGSGGQGLGQSPSSCQQGGGATGGAGTTTTCATSTPTAQPVSTGPTADWMGMQIVTSPSGVVVNTVRPGSAGDVAGFEPGDQILAVDGHVIGAVSELRTDTSNISLGGSVTIAVLRDSVTLNLSSVRMTQRPTIHP